MEKLELRVMQTSISTEGSDMIVEGLVNKTESWSHTLGMRKKFREKICRGAFDKAIQTAPRIDFLAEHDSSKLLATTENGSLQLWEDAEGLKMRAKICPTSYGKDMYELMKSNLVRHMSFGFRVISDKWKKLANGTFERTVDALELSEVSVVRNPAYPQSAIAARGIELVEDVDIPEEILEERSQEEMNKELVEEFRSMISDLVEGVRELAEEFRAFKLEKEKELKEDSEKEDFKEETSEENKPEKEEKEESKESDEDEKSDEKEESREEDEDSKEDSEKEENRSFDLAAYRARIKDKR